jgi:hypothetical protein
MLIRYQRTVLSTENQNHDDYGNSTNNETKEDLKAVEAMEELQKEQRDVEQLDVNSGDVLQEKEKRQPHSTEKE